MNPETSIRPWLLASGAQFGIRQVHEYRWADAKTRLEEPYCTYRIISTEATHQGTLDQSTKTVNTRHHKGVKHFKTTVEVMLHNSQDGMYELSAFTVAAHHVDSVRSLLNDNGCTFVEELSITNESKWDDNRIDYAHKMICTFNHWVEISIDEINAVVDEIQLTLESGGDTWTITSSGYE